MKFCVNCKKVLEDTQNFCVICGSKATVLPDASEKTEDDFLFDKMEVNASAEADNADFSAIENENQEKKVQDAYLEKQRSLSDNYFLGFLGALAGGLLAAIPWAIVACYGRFYSWLGYLLTIVVAKGYDLMKVKAGFKKLWCVAGAVIISVFAAQVMSDVFFILTDEELSGMLAEIFSYYTQNFGEYISMNAGNLILGLLFAGIGGLRIFKEIKNESVVIKQLKETNSEDLYI